MRKQINKPYQHDNYELHITFANGETRIYNANPIIQNINNYQTEYAMLEIDHGIYHTKARNKVVQGKYLGANVTTSFGKTSIITSMLQAISLNNNLKSYQKIDTTNKKKGIHHLNVELEDGSQSILEIDDKIYNTICKINNHES